MSDLEAENERLRKFLQNIVTANDLENYDGALFGTRYLADMARAALRGDPYPGEETPKSSLYYIIKALKRGASLEVVGDAFCQPVTHISLYGGTGPGRVVLRPEPCPCDCHDPTKGIIMHDQMCCEPFIYPSQAEKEQG